VDTLENFKKLNPSVIKTANQIKIKIRPSLKKYPTAKINPADSSAVQK
jgi:hypothetical protein